MAIPSATVTLEDVADPVLTAAPSGTALDGTRPVSGVVGASFSAADNGGGVARAVLEVDGTAVAELPAGGADCAPPYTRRVPCKPTASGTVSWDTRTVPNGAHRVRLVVYDATRSDHVAAGPFLRGHRPQPRRGRLRFLGHRDRGRLEGQGAADGLVPAPR